MVDLQVARNNGQMVIDAFDDELRKFRVGRATPALIDGVEVEVYGSKMPINQLANVSVLDAHMLTIQPWDKSNKESIVKAINAANLGLNPVVDEDYIRISIPPITEERRQELAKNLGLVAEEFRIRLRQARKDFMGDIKNAKESAEISEDEETRLKDELQKIIDEFNKKIEEKLESKRQDILIV